MCFNWKDPAATTSRYVEALAIGMIPFVYKNYDENNTYNIDDWQRVNDFEDFQAKINILKDPTAMDFLLSQYRKNYEEVLLSKNEYYEKFSYKMNRAIS